MNRYFENTIVVYLENVTQLLTILYVSNLSPILYFSKLHIIKVMQIYEYILIMVKNILKYIFE